ncbi:MAG: NADH-quinone oxidoreductase subunit M, partial [Gammaproteobacteria bacterium]|nr:NADH-quinone oxidoreductase subunit M [Gammaproteobacteria bacterium]
MSASIPLLSLVIWLPIFGGVAALVAGDQAPDTARRVALGASVVTFLLSIPLFTGFDRATPLMQFVELTPWVDTFNINYHVGVDGISMPLILLTTFTTVLVVIAGWGVIQRRVAQYMAAFLILEGLLVGTFVALDAVLFYVFFEGMLI